MNPHEPDNRIQQLFSEQRETDQRRVPSFDRTWRAATVRASEPARTSWAVPVAVAVSVALMAAISALWWLRDGKSQPAVNTTVVVSINDWASPTDCLLEMPTWSASSGSQP